jgi:hypothetical protein
MTLRGVGGHRYPSGAFSLDSSTYVIGTAAGLHEITLAPPYRTRGINVVRDQNRWPVPVVAVRNGVAIETRTEAKTIAIAFVPLDAPARTVVRPVEGGNTVGGYAAQNRLVVVASYRGRDYRKPSRIWLYDIDRPNAPPSLVGKGGGSDRPMISPDGRYLAIHLDDKLALFDLDKQEKRWAVGSPRNALSAAGFTQGNRWLFAGDYKGDQISLEVETGRERWRESEIDRSKRGAWLRAVSAQLGLLIAAIEGDRIELLNLDLQHVAFLGFPHQYGWDTVPTALEASPDGKWAAIAYRGRVHLWDLARREPTYLIDPRIRAR